MQTLEALGRHYKFSLNEAWEDLPKRAKEIILHGSGEEEVKFIYDDGLRRYETKKACEGVVPLAVTLSTLAIVITPPRWLSDGSGVFLNSQPATPGTP